MRNLLSSSTRGAQLFLLASIITSVWWFITNDVSLASVGLVLLGYFVYGCLGIVVTFHRKLTHESYNTWPLLTKIFAIFGCFAGTGSPLAWVAIHINHHLKSDQPGDPHSPVYEGAKIFLLNYAHQVDASTKFRMRNIVSDPFHQFLHRYYFAVLFVWGAILFLIGGMQLLVPAFLAPAVVTALMSNVVNYVGHKPNWLGGSRRFNLKDFSANNWIWAIPSWGEAWHNNHHRYPKRWNFGMTAYEIDISAMVIRLIKTK